MENTNENQIENTEQTTENTEKKPTKKALIIGIIIGVIVLIAIGLGLYFGTKTPNETGKKEDKIEKETDKEIETNEEEKDDTSEENTESAGNNTQTEESDAQENQTTEPVVEKTTMYAKSNVNVRSGAGTSNSQIGSLTKGQEVVKTGEENGWSKIEFNGGVGYVKSEYLSTEKVEVETSSNSNTNSTTGGNTSSNNGTTSNGTSNNNSGSTSTPSTSGMYTMMDTASKERFSKCGSILQGGLAGQYMQWQDTFIDYFNGNVVMSNNNTDGSWMYMDITGWSTNKGSEETAPAYDEIPVLVKQCMESIAPEGGAALYNTINSLIMQYNGPRNVPTQGRISESIPGLYVTLVHGKYGLEVTFFAE